MAPTLVSTSPRSTKVPHPGHSGEPAPLSPPPAPDAGARCGVVRRRAWPCCNALRTRVGQPDRTKLLPGAARSTRRRLAAPHQGTPALAAHAPALTPACSPTAQPTGPLHKCPPAATTASLCALPDHRIQLGRHSHTAALSIPPRCPGVSGSPLWCGAAGRRGYLGSGGLPRAPTSVHALRAHPPDSHSNFGSSRSPDCPPCPDPTQTLPWCCKLRLPQRSCVTHAHLLAAFTPDASYTTATTVL